MSSVKRLCKGFLTQVCAVARHLVGIPDSVAAASGQPEDETCTGMEAPLSAEPDGYDADTSSHGSGSDSDSEGENTITEIKLQTWTLDPKGCIWKCIPNIIKRHLVKFPSNISAHMDNLRRVNPLKFTVEMGDGEYDLVLVLKPTVVKNVVQGKMLSMFRLSVYQPLTTLADDRSVRKTLANHFTEHVYRLMHDTAPRTYMAQKQMWVDDEVDHFWEQCDSRYDTDPTALREFESKKTLFCSRERIHLLETGLLHGPSRSVFEIGITLLDLADFTPGMLGPVPNTYLFNRILQKPEWDVVHKGHERVEKISSKDIIRGVWERSHIFVAFLMGSHPRLGHNPHMREALNREICCMFLDNLAGV